MRTNRKKALAILNDLERKSMDDSKYVAMREGETPKKGARVIADGRAGAVLGSEVVNAPDATNTNAMKPHLVVKVSHPEGTTKQINGVGDWSTVVAPAGGYDQHYAGSRIKVHQDDIIPAK